MQGTDALVLVLFVAMPLVRLAALVDAGRRPRHHWQAIGRPKALWVVGVLVVGWVPALYYLAVVRPRLAEVRHLPAPPRQRVPWRRSEWGDPWAD